MDKISTSTQASLPPIPGGRKGKDNPVDRQRIRDLYFEGHVTEAARLMRLQGYTLKQTSQYLSLPMYRLTPLVDQLPTPNVVHQSQYVAQAFAHRPDDPHLSAGISRFQHALSQRDVEFFRGMDDLGGCNRTHQPSDTILRSHDPHKLHRCLAWLEKFWSSTDFTLHAKVMRRVYHPEPSVCVSFWAEHMGIDPLQFDKSQVILKDGWFLTDNRDATHGVLELRYRSRQLTKNLLGLWAAKRHLRTRIGRLRGRLSMADYVLGEQS